MRQLAIFVALLIAVGVPTAYAEPFGPTAFRQVWERTDFPVQQGVAQHSWVWGPEPFTPAWREYFVSGEGQTRQVQYIDKGRFEINDPNANPNAPWYVTSGLLGRELIEGRVQVGQSAFIPLAPANLAVVGDPNNDFPTYASLQRVYEFPAGAQVGDHVTRVFLREGAASFDQYANDPATEIAQVEREFGIPRAFWEFMNKGGTVFSNGRFRQAEQLFDWLYVTGYPVTPAFWTRARIAGVEQDVMFQVFERRVLTYVPSNPVQFQVEMGNIGRHYHTWRYEQALPADQQAMITVPAASATVTSPLQIQGFEKGQAFEAAITVRLRTEGGEVLASANTLVQRPDINVTGPFSATLTFAQPAMTTPGVVEVVVASARDGSQSVIASQQVTIGAGQSGNSGQPAGAPVDRAKQDLAQRIGVASDTIVVDSVAAMEWDNPALGCPAADQAYATVITPGYQIILQSGGQEYDYRADTGRKLILCQSGKPIQTTAQ